MQTMHGGVKEMSNYNKINKLGTKVSVGILSCVSVMLLQVNTVYGAEDPNVGMADDNIENMIEVGKSLIGQTEYVYGGGHSDWEEQKTLEVPTGLDNSAYVSWVLYNGMGIDMGMAPVAGNFENYFETISVGSLDDIKRGDLVATDSQIEIYLGKSDDGNHYSLAATNDRSNVDIIETSWGLNVEELTVMRPSVSDAESGKNGLAYDKDAILAGGLGEGAFGSGNEIVRESTDGGGEPDKETDKEGTDKDSDTESDSEEEVKGNTNDIDEDLRAWLNPIVDFTGDSDSHSKSVPEGKRIDGNTKGLKGHKQGMFDLFF